MAEEEESPPEKDEEFGTLYEPSDNDCALRFDIFRFLVIYGMCEAMELPKRILELEATISGKPRPVVQLKSVD